MAVNDTQVLVLADDGADGGKGSLFERFVAKLLAEQYGFEDPTRRDLNVTSDGIELDIVATHRLTGGKAIAECKAYGRNVKAAELTNFYGKLTIERFKDPQAFGLLCALPRLTAEGQEKAREIEREDKGFRYLSGDDLSNALLRGGLIADPPASIEDASDPAVVVTETGVFAACIVLDSIQRTPTQIAVWAVTGRVPNSVLELVRVSEFANGMPVYDAGVNDLPAAPKRTQHEADTVLLTRVVGSSSDFEYQLPASPRYFVGRRGAVDRLNEALATRRGRVLVLNAQSGWGKSSLALKMHDLATRRRGVAIILDTRTADHPRYVIEVLRRLGSEAQSAGILDLPATASWASLDSALGTLREATWNDSDRPLLAFFDQFENVFRDVELTRSFRNLALGSREIPGPLVIGFAWKTDLVGWTEGHPYQLRNDIRGAGSVVVVEPFGPSEVTVLLGRLDKQAAIRLLPDLRSRLRAYSQGLPWLLKKLADHVLRELKHGVTQEQLLAESLNVVGLFEADLAELSPSQHEVIRHVARFAPIAASEVTERFGPDSVQSLVDRRLLVQVGDRLDTYWDTFRDFLNTGSVPVQDSYILRQTPRSVARLLPVVVEAGGSASVRDLVEILETSDKAIFNLSRELRLLGVTAHEPNMVRLVDEVLDADDREMEMRRRIATALRRHRAHSTFRKLAERSGGIVTLDSYARDLPNAFPAVDVARTSWTSYARAFLFWMEYAGLIIRQGADYISTSEPVAVPTLRLLDAPTPVKARPGVPYIAPRRALDLLKQIRIEGEIDLPAYAKDREAVGALVAMGAVSVSPERTVRLAVSELVHGDGEVSGPTLRSLLAGVPGGQQGLDALTADSRCSPKDVGEAIAAAAHMNWTAETTRNVGGHFRAWAKAAGITIKYPRRGSKPAPDAANPALWDLE